MRIRDLHELPKMRDSFSYLYVDRCIIDRKYKAVEAIDKGGRTLIPAATLSVLLLGPGTSITHEAVKTLTDNGCSLLWVGEEGVRMYAQGHGETRRGYQLIKQAELVSNPVTRMEVVLRMYQFRFDEKLDPTLTLEQVRGYEGQRVRRAYAEASEKYGVPWHGRNYDRRDWNAADPINRALSAANASLNGISHAAIVSAGYSPGLGFVHTGKQFSFVYDIADLYKTSITVPIAFYETSQGEYQLESRVRRTCRDAFYQLKLLGRIVSDIDRVLDLSKEILEAGREADSDPARPEPWWTPPGMLDTDSMQGAV